MKKILIGIVALFLFGFISIAFSQQISKDDIIDARKPDEHGCSVVEMWDEEQGVCIVQTICKRGEKWDGTQKQCVPNVREEHECSTSQVWNGEQGQCVDVGEDPAVKEPLHVPSLEHWTLEESGIANNEIYLVFAPKGTPNFYLHVYLYNENGRDILATWCSGDESLCKAVGNGKTCSGEPLGEGPDAWCYEETGKS